MKAKSLLSIISYSNKSIDPSIIDVASKVYHLLKYLSKFDSIFERTHHFNGSKETEIEISNEVTIDKIAQLILNSERNEITQHEGIINPTIYYKRKGGGFSFNSRFLIGSDKRFAFNYGCGYLVDGVSIYNFNKDYEYDYAWYEQIIRRVVDHMNPFFASIYINNQPWNIFYNQMNIKYPIGWITYFSDRLEFNIPDDLNEVKYKFEDGGKFLYTSDEDFMKDKDAYFSNREKLERVINEIKYRVPKFVKEDN